MDASSDVGTGAPIINLRSGDRDCLLDYIGAGSSGLYFTEAGRIDPRVLAFPDKLTAGAEQFTLIAIARFFYPGKHHRSP